MEKAVFMDRDGVIIEDTGYIGQIDRCRFLPGVSRAVKSLNAGGFKVIIITNQSGVARGYFSEEAVREVNQYITEKLAREGALIDRIYYCPHHKDGVVEAYRKDCYCRKPNPGMIEQAVLDFGLDISRSFLIGDKASDIEAGHRAGCRTILLAASGYTVTLSGDIAADHVTPDISEATKWLKKHS
jgi:D-glycero-D-manno-heptose 1,7-bisphosphate phosphatase